MKKHKYYLLILIFSIFNLYAENVKLLYDFSPDDLVEIIPVNNNIYVFTKRENSKIKLTVIENGQKKELYNLVRKIVDSTYYFDDGTRDYNNFYTNIVYLNSKFYLTSYENDGVIILDTLGNVLSKSSIGREYYILLFEFNNNNKSFYIRDQSELVVYEQQSNKKLKLFKPSDYGLINNDSLYYHFKHLINIDNRYLIIGYKSNNRISLKKQRNTPFALIIDTLNFGKRDFYYTLSNNIINGIFSLIKLNNSFVCVIERSDPVTFETNSEKYISYDTLRTLIKVSDGFNQKKDFSNWGLIQINDSVLMNYGQRGTFFLSIDRGHTWLAYDSINGNGIDRWSTIKKAFIFEGKIMLGINNSEDTKIVELILSLGTNVEQVKPEEYRFYFSNNTLFLKEEVDDIELFDMKGISVLTKAKLNCSLALPNLNKGCYFATYKQLGKHFIEKIMVE